MDITQLTEVLGLASSAAGVTNKAASTIATIKGLFDDGKAPDSEQATALLNSLAIELTTANMMNVQLSDALKELSRELQRQDEFEKEIARYELFETPLGDVLYKLRDDMRNGQPPHFICPVCKNRDRLISFVTGNPYNKACQTNSTHHFIFQKSPPIRL
ncbi:hypothetical protein [Nioella ostreopsis]|uniref:hypothetical protein n=1 Tax=Nioella ostreopsis TaxID=2448479 RepID=UPI000FD95D01|nr:hypothetical protein [Nioella ostreopsis]